MGVERRSNRSRIVVVTTALQLLLVNHLSIETDRKATSLIVSDLRRWLQLRFDRDRRLPECGLLH